MEEDLLLPLQTCLHVEARRERGEMTELELSRSRNAMGSYQDLVDGHGFTLSKNSIGPPGEVQVFCRIIQKLPGANLSASLASSLTGHRLAPDLIQPALRARTLCARIS
jgi:hypothetical protein